MATKGRGRASRPLWRVGVLGVTVLSGAVFVSGAVTAGGTDLRPLGGDVRSLVQDRSREVEARRAQVTTLQSEVDRLIAGGEADPQLETALEEADKAAPAAGFEAIEGPGLRVSLSDTPRSVKVPDGVDPNVLIVHQQDIQGFVNALWAGGAQAVTLQGQRLISTTGIKCVGSTVVLDGVPYSPPYVIEAVGDAAKLRAALNDSPEVSAYQTYVRRYQLGLQIQSLRAVDAPAFTGALDLRHATATED